MATPSASESVDDDDDVFGHIDSDADSDAGDVGIVIPLAERSLR